MLGDYRCRPQRPKTIRTQNLSLSLYLLCAPLCHNSLSLYLRIQNSENTDGIMMRGIWFDGFIRVLVSFLLMRLILNFIFKPTTKGIKVDLVWSSPAMAVLDLVWSSPAMAIWWFCTELGFARS